MKRFFVFKNGLLVLLLLFALFNTSVIPQTGPTVSGAVIRHADPYALGTGDMLKILFYEDGSITDPGQAVSAVVQEDGTIFVPLLGSIVATGKQPRELETQIRKSASRYLSMPIVRVEIVNYQSHYITLLGAFRFQAIYPLTRPAMLTDAIVEHGGLLPEADVTRLAVIRKNGDRININLQSYYELGDSSQDIPLYHGDKVFAPVMEEPFLLKATRVAQIAVLVIQVITLVIVLTQ